MWCYFSSSGRAVHALWSGPKQRHRGALQPWPSGAYGQHAPHGSEAAVPLRPWLRQKVRHGPVRQGSFIYIARCTQGDSSVLSGHIGESCRALPAFCICIFPVALMQWGHTTLNNMHNADRSVKKHSTAQIIYMYCPCKFFLILLYSILLLCFRV